MVKDACIRDISPSGDSNQGISHTDGSIRDIIDLSGAIIRVTDLSGDGRPSKQPINRALSPQSSVQGLIDMCMFNCQHLFVVFRSKPGSR